MSSATPAAFLSAISITTTSASCLSATPRATVAPTFPAPPTTVTFRFISAPRSSVVSCRPVSRPRPGGEPNVNAENGELHVLDDRVGELRRLQLGGAVHQPREV